MNLAIMQPYFLPYIGYFQLMSAADVFVVYDNIKYTKKGWINRNRMLRNGTDVTFSLPIKSDSDYKDVRERQLADDFRPQKLLRQFAEAYRAAPHAGETLSLLESILKYPDPNLFGFVAHSIDAVRQYLGVETQILISSTISIDHSLKAQEKVLALCEELGARTYINAIGGLDLYSREGFAERGIELRFIKPRGIQYSQFASPFVPWLSIIDVMMFNPKNMVRDHVLHSYDLI